MRHKFRPFRLIIGESRQVGRQGIEANEDILSSMSLYGYARILTLDQDLVDPARLPESSRLRDQSSRMRTSG